MPSLPAADKQKAKTDREALARFQHWLREPLRALAPSAAWLVLPSQKVVGQHAITTVPQAVRFERASGGPVYLAATITFCYIDHPDPERKRERKVKTMAYAYTLSRDESLDDSIVRWEWHPDLLEWPHLHVTAGVQGERAGHKMHLPTGRVAFENVLDFLLRDLDVEVPDRPAAEAALKESLRRFHANKTWG